MKDKYEELGCEFMNESACEEQLDEEGTDMGNAEREHFEEREY